jgi:hypothetical protein
MWIGRRRRRGAWRGSRMICLASSLKKLLWYEVRQNIQ